MLRLYTVTVAEPVLTAVMVTPEVSEPERETTAELLHTHCAPMLYKSLGAAAMLMRQLSPGKISMLYVSSEIFCTSGTGVGSGVASMTCGRGVGVTFGVGFGVGLGSSAVF